MASVAGNARVRPFQDDLDRIISERVPLWLRLTAPGLAGLLVALLALAAATRIDTVVSGRGRLASDRPVAVLQPMQRAMIRAIAVRPGDSVRSGQVLATLDPTFAQADLTALQAQARALAGEVARLQAEAAAAPLSPATAPDQIALYTQRQREYAARLASFDQALLHDSAEAATAQNQRGALQRQFAIATHIRDMRADLLRGAVGSRLQFLGAEAALAQAEGDLRHAGDHIAELAHAAASHRADRQAFIENWRREVLDTLAARRTALAQTQAALDKAAHVQALISITAPQDGVVLAVTPRAPGSYLGEAETLLTLLPAHAGLVAEITIKSADIGQIRVGDPVTLKIDAYPFQQHGMLAARVHAIEAASFDPDTHDPLSAGALHRVLLDVAPGSLADLPPGTGPIPGMTLSADIKTGTRSVLGYFLAPLTRGLRQSLREP